MYLRSKSNFIKNNYFLFYDTMLGVVASLLPFVKPATFAILFFLFLNILFLRKIRFTKTTFLQLVLISSPFFLHIVFLLNNDSIYEGLKHTEKYISLLVFPILIIGQQISVSISKVLKVYSFLFTLILFLGFLTHFLRNYELFQQYFNGILVWQMGYKFATSLNSHGPALNMHVAFLVVTNVYLVINSLLSKHNNSRRVFRLILLLLSLGVLFVLNTRVAFLNTILGVLLISIISLKNKISRKKLIISISTVFLFLASITTVFIYNFPYMVKKYTDVTFKHMDKIGSLDDFENPEAEVYSSLVTRLSIWKSTLDIAKNNLLFGVGAADGKPVLFKSYTETNQLFLAKHKFPVHNQYLDFLLKFGILGLLVLLAYMFNILWIAKTTKSALALFFFILFSTSNLTDDFLLRFDGIVFSAFWICLFASKHTLNVSSKSLPSL